MKTLFDERAFFVFDLWSDSTSKIGDGGPQPVRRLFLSD